MSFLSNISSLLNRLRGSRRYAPFSRERLAWILCGTFVVYFIVCIRVVYLCVYYKSKDTLVSSPFRKIIGYRVPIIDRTGSIVAASIELNDFYLNRDLVSDPSGTSSKIVAIFPDMDENAVEQKIIDTQRGSKHILIRKQITPDQVQRIKQSGILGFEFMDSVARIYPHGNLFSHVVGYTFVDNKAASGLELQYDRYLKSQNNPLILTLDGRIQAIVRQQLLKGIKKYNAKSMIGIISEVKTGNILAMVSLPDFNPNHISTADSNSLYNRASFGAYEMGSVFKLFTIAAALEYGAVNTKDRFDIAQTIKYGNYEVKQQYFTKRFLTMGEILEQSSNVGAGLVGLRIGAERMKMFLGKLNFFERLPISFPALATPLYPKQWREVNTLTASYGYGIAISPLHVIMAVNGLVNDGIMITPRFVQGDTATETQIVSSATSALMRNFMRNVVLNGSGWRANTLGYAVGGKTGSARLLHNGSYQEGNIMANFIGVFPMNNPHFSVYVMVESPIVKESNMDLVAGNIAAPLVSRIIESIAPILNIVPFVEK